MAKTGSYIKLDRGLKNNALWLEKPFSKGQAWVDLLILAQGIDVDKRYRGQIQHMKPGEVYTSILYLTNRWGWSRNKVYRFLDMLQKAEMIVLNGQKPSATLGETIERTRNDTKNGTTNGTIITIVNWEFYQYCDTNNDTKDGTPNDTTNRTPNGTHNRKHIRESNKEKAINNSRSAPKPKTIDDIVPERDLAGFPLFEDMPCEADGSKRDIPPRVRHLFDSDYGAYRRYMERCSMK